MGKILIFALKEGVGGGEEYALNYARQKNSYDVEFGYVILGNKTFYEDELKRLNAQYYFVPDKNQLVQNILGIYHLFKKLRNEYQTIYFNTSGLYYPIPYILAEMFNYDILLHSHSMKPAEKFQFKRILHYINRTWIRKKTRGNFACSYPAGEWMFGKRYMQESRVTIIPNAINLDKYKINSAVNNEIRKKNGWQDKIIVGNISRFSKEKNHGYIMRVFKELTKISDKYMLLLVGTGELESKTRQLAKEMKIENSVVFYGQTQNPEYIIQCMDCILMPSIQEGFPITLVEAQAAGVQCVVSDNITKEVNICKSVHFFSINESPMVWAEAINQLDFTRKENIAILKKAGFDILDVDSRVLKLMEEGR